ncbi:MAG: hypothetical protein KDH96_11805, partial [Candidatus Riesia sp.]|nr:hypothetical protein [Candidatus Riesia sp.]
MTCTTVLCCILQIIFINQDRWISYNFFEEMMLTLATSTNEMILQPFLIALNSRISDLTKENFIRLYSKCTDKGVSSTRNL